MDIKIVQKIVMARYKANTVEKLALYGECGIEPEAVLFLRNWYDAHPEPKPTTREITNVVYAAWEEYSCNAGEPCPMLTEHMLRDYEGFEAVDSEPVYKDLEIDTPQGTVYVDADVCRLFHLPK
jgi:hypothetical protein